VCHIGINRNLRVHDEAAVAGQVENHIGLPAFLFLAFARSAIAPQAPPRARLRQGDLLFEHAPLARADAASAACRKCFPQKIAAGTSTAKTPTAMPSKKCMMKNPDRTSTSQQSQRPNVPPHSISSRFLGE
jgi:hypothetical protein